MQLGCALLGNIKINHEESRSIYFRALAEFPSEKSLQWHRQVAFFCGCACDYPRNLTTCGFVINEVVGDNGERRDR